jgi:hypothetical protein
MDRRGALELGGWALLAGVLPWPLLRALQAPQGSGAPANARLRRALDRAREVGKPLLVVVAPSSPEARYEVGYLLSHAFEVGGAELRADLALCEVTCADRAQLTALAGDVPEGAVLGLIEHHRGALAWTTIAVELGASPAEFWSTSDDVLRGRAARNAGRLRAAIAGEPVLAERVAAADRALPDAFVAELQERLGRRSAISVADVDRAAALVRGANYDGRWTHVLAAAATLRIWETPPSGSRWAAETGCGGPDLEFLDGDDDAVRHDLSRRALGRPPLPKDANGRPIAPPGPPPSLGALCGMGSVSGISRRFLFFYTDEP